MQAIPGHHFELVSQVEFDYVRKSNFSAGAHLMATQPPPFSVRPNRIQSKRNPAAKQLLVFLRQWMELNSADVPHNTFNRV